MQFKAEVFQNQFLPQGAREVHAIMTVSAEGNGTISSTSNTGQNLFGIICDVSGSMDGNKTPNSREGIRIVIAVNIVTPVAMSYKIVHRSARLRRPELGTGDNIGAACRAGVRVHDRVVVGYDAAARFRSSES